jgi:outer membrane protein OmpA-like peptidoglycan-associated protein
VPVLDYGNTRTVLESEPVDSVPNQPVPVEGEPLDKQSYMIEFAFDSYDLTDSSSRLLEEVCQVLQKHPEAVVEVVGHTDFIGSDGYNDLLSERRAEAVARFLVGKGIVAKVQAGYRGERLPLESNLTPDGRARNRRTEILIREE